jgi:Zn-dependent alcohol dehydrogenase
MKTAAAVAHGLRTPLVVEDIELPDLQDTEVLIRIVAVGVCHTDLASLDGQLPAPFPATFGHEGAGVVERVGETVRGFMEGDSIPDIFIPQMIDLYAPGRFPFDQFVRFYPFDAINRAIEDQRNGSAIKPILEVSAS